MIRPALSAAMFAAILAPTPAAANDLCEQIVADLPGLMATYRDFHANPELSFSEVRSAAIMAAAARKAEWSCTRVMIGQPADEIGQGAKAMLDDGLFTRFPKPDFALAFHDMSGIVEGTVAYASGPAMASAIVMRLQTLVSRENNPLDPAVITVGSFHAGSKYNIISDSAKLQLTVRSFDDAQRQR